MNKFFLFVANRSRQIQKIYSLGFPTNNNDVNNMKNVNFVVVASLTVLVFNTQINSSCTECWPVVLVCGRPVNHRPADIL